MTSTETMRLLIVEDEHLIREMLRDAVTDANFEAVFAPDGRIALEEIKGDSARLCAVITDINLGSGPTGWDIARRARELVPEIPVIYMTGAAADDWSAYGVPNSVLIHKPFVPAQIITAIANLLNKTQ